MAERRMFNVLSVYALAVIMAVAVFTAGRAAGQSGIGGNVEEKLGELSEEQKLVLQRLFSLSQEIGAMEVEMTRNSQEAAAAAIEIQKLQKNISAEEEAFARKREALKQVLRSYQRMGPSSYLDIILSSDSLADFLSRLNVLRDITRNTGEIMIKLDESKERLVAEEGRLTQKIRLLAEAQERLEISMQQTRQLKAEMEEYMASLEEERAYYQSQLANLQQVWAALKKYIPEVTKKFSQIIQEAELPPDAIKITLTLNGVRATISDAALNNIISEQGLSDLVFAFNPGRVEFSLPDKKLFLSGIFVLDGQTLTFRAQQGTFHGMELKGENLDELFSGAELQLHLHTLAGGNTLRSLEIRSGYLDLLLVPSLSR